MPSIKKCVAPANTMLDEYSKKPGAYTDCYTTQIPVQVLFPEFILAFYTTWLFKLERFILAFTASRPSTDLQARQLADGEITQFAAWDVEGRTADQLLMCDLAGRTRSWFQVLPNANGTQLYFGSAVGPPPGKPAPDFVFTALLGFHQIYSRLLLYFAALKLQSRIPSKSQK